VGGIAVMDGVRKKVVEQLDINHINRFRHDDAE
jgi:hypothetical protein